jgi:hypothetical protein
MKNEFATREGQPLPPEQENVMEKNGEVKVRSRSRGRGQMTTTRMNIRVGRKKKKCLNDT